MVKGGRSWRKCSGGTVHLQKLYSTDGAVGNLRYKETALKHKPNTHKPGIPLQEDELVKGQGAVKPEPPKTQAGRKRVLEELGAVLSGKKSRSD